MALVILVGLMSRSAAALTPAEGVMRRQLIADAEKAHNAGDHARALSLAQRASALEATPSLHYFIAREEEETGALADGYGTAQQCELEAQHDPQLRGRDEILKKCREIESRLKERVGYVVVDVKDRPTGLRVKLSGQDLNEAALGIPYVITPGTVVVEATAPAHSPYRIEIAVPEGKTVNVSVTLAPQVPEAVATNSCPAGQRRRSAGSLRRGLVRGWNGSDSRQPTLLLAWSDLANRRGEVHRRGAVSERDTRRGGRLRIAGRADTSCDDISLRRSGQRPKRRAEHFGRSDYLGRHGRRRADRQCGHLVHGRLGRRRVHKLQQRLHSDRNQQPRGPRSSARSGRRYIRSGWHLSDCRRGDLLLL